jgi:hypothetical protein
MLLSLTTKFVPSNGARNVYVVKHAITERSASTQITVVALHPVVFGFHIYIFPREALQQR